MFKRWIKPSSIICLLVAAIGGTLVFSLKESQEGVINFPIIKGDTLGIYHNPEGPLDWKQIQDPDSEKYFIPAPSQNELPTLLTKGSSGSLYTWVRIPLENSDDEAKNFCLEVATKWIDLARLYSPQQNGNYTTMETGEIMAYDDRAIPSRRPAFSVTLMPNSQSVYYLFLEEQNHVFVPVIKLWNSIEDFNRMMLAGNKQISLHFSIYYSIFLFSVIAYLIIRSRDLLYYLIYLFLAGIAQINLSMLLNVLYPFKLIDSKWFNDTFYVVHAIASGFFVLFTLEFLEMRKNMPRSDKLLRYFAWLYVCIMPTLNLGIFKLSPFIEFVLVIYGGIVITIICFLVGIIRIRQKSYQAYFYLLAYLIYTISHYRLCFVSITEIEPPHIMIVQWLHGYTLEVIILNIALSDRLLSIKKDKEYAQQKAYNEAKAFNELQNNYTQSLHQQVDQQTTLLRLENKKKDELFQIIGNNLRTPLQNVTDLSSKIAHLSALKDKATFRHQVINIQLISFNLLNHLENLLQWARLKVESLPFKLEKYNIHTDIFEPFLKKHQSLIQKNQIRLRLDIDKKLYVYADLHAIKIILRNLIVYMITSFRNSDCIILTAFENNSNTCIQIECQQAEPEIQEMKNLPENTDSKRHFAIQLCKQLLSLHGSKLFHRITDEHRTLFEFELESAVEPAKVR